MCCDYRLGVYSLLTDVLCCDCILGVYSLLTAVAHVVIADWVYTVC